VREALLKIGRSHQNSLGILQPGSEQTVGTGATPSISGISPATGAGLGQIFNPTFGD
jgi:hypothetical protein